MTSVSDAISLLRDRPHRTSLDPVRLAASGPMAVAIVILAALQQAVGHLNGDVSWFITFAEKVLGGARPYIDVGDPNPPAAFLAYMAPVLAARATGVRAEFFTVVELFLLAAGSMALARRILQPVLARNAEGAGLLRNATLWVLLVAPGFGFAEREHIALALILPLFAVLAMRADGRAVRFAAALLAGVAGGAALTFKPHYALALGGGAFVTAVAQRSLARLLTAELLAAGMTVALYALIVWFYVPAYASEMMPLALHVYAPARQDAYTVLSSPLVLVNAGLLLTVFLTARRFAAPPSVLVLGSASLGFLITVVVQGKLWFNHAYPGLALAVLAAFVLWLTRRGEVASAERFGRGCVVPALVCLLFFSAPTMDLPGAEEHPGLRETVRAVAPGQPRIAALAAQLDLGHPLVRQLDGSWIGRQNALWISDCVNRILATTRVTDERRAMLAGFSRQDRTDFAFDITSGRPDVLIVENAALRHWAERQPEFAALFRPYDHVADAGEVEVWRRRVHEGAAVSASDIATSVERTKRGPSL